MASALVSLDAMRDGFSHTGDLPKDDPSAVRMNQNGTAIRIGKHHFSVFSILHDAQRTFV